MYERLYAQGRMLAASLAVALVPAVPGGNAGADDSVYLSMSNRIGLIEYCCDKGHLSDEVAAAAAGRVARARATLQPPATEKASADREEAGRNGRWGARGIPAETQARVFGQTLEQYCLEQAE